MDETQEIERKLLYSVIVAGKSAVFAENALARFLSGADEETPFQYVRRLKESGRLYDTLKECRCGNYTKICQCFLEVVDVDVGNCSVADLEAIHGIGPKTARFFLLWTRPGVRFAALDTHVLKWLRKVGYDAPHSTPSGRKYRELEVAFLQEADDMGLTPRELDWKIWSEYAGYESIVVPVQDELPLTICEDQYWLLFG